MAQSAQRVSDTTSVQLLLRLLSAAEVRRLIKADKERPFLGA
jgi:hypothetical protein